MACCLIPTKRVYATSKRGLEFAGMIVRKNPYTVGVILALSCLVASAQVGQGSTRATSPQELFKHLSPSVFVVESLDAKGNPITLGSGVSIAPDQIVTNRHVVEDGKSWRVRQGESTWAAAIAFLDAEHDLCGLKVAGLKSNPVSLRLSSTLSVGEHVYTLGAPEGLELSLSEGLVSALRKFEGISFIQTTAPISHGSSGGGLFDSQGNLIGITTFTVKDGQNLNFAIPTDLVVGLKDHAAAEIRHTEAEMSASRAMVLSQAAYAAAESGNYQKALEYSNQLVMLTPNDPFLWSYMGTLYLKVKQPDNAVTACQKAVSLAPDLADGWGCLGDVYTEPNQYAQAEEALKKALDRDPSHDAQLANVFGLGLVYCLEGKRLAVMDTYNRLKPLDQNYADLYFRQCVQPVLETPH
jgi:Flp pilus assembly protein TadD